MKKRWLLRVSVVLIALVVAGVGCANDAEAVLFAARRLREAVGDHYWKVEVRDREIIIEAPRSVAFAYTPAGAPAGVPADKEELTRLKVCRYTLRFGRRLPEAEYKRLRGEHQAMMKKYEALQARVRHIDHKFDHYLPSSEADKKLLAEYRRAVAKLGFLDLPDLYTPDHSIRLYRSWAVTREYPKAKRVSVRVQELEDTLLKLFGVYHPRVAGNRRTFGRFLKATP